MKPLLDPLLDVEQNADEPKLEFAGGVDGVDRVGGVSSRWKPTPDMVAVFILGACLAVSALLVLILALYCLMQCWRQRAHSSSHKCITKYSELPLGNACRLPVIKISGASSCSTVNDSSKLKRFSCMETRREKELSGMKSSGLALYECLREEDSAVSDKERLAVTDESIQSGAMQE
uniref:Cadherin cytoplasmic C-terminal domain-containing protein n=1 Tax=Ascaris lumbricoides TaxID=6252 RepID=A0A0M3I324_ASCLU